MRGERDRGGWLFPRLLAPHSPVPDSLVPDLLCRVIRDFSKIANRKLFEFQPDATARAHLAAFFSRLLRSPSKGTVRPAMASW